MSLRTLTCHENSSFYKPSMQNKLAFTSSKNALIMNITRSNKPTMQNNFALTQRRNALIVTMNIPHSMSQPSKIISLSQKVETC